MIGRRLRGMGWVFRRINWHGYLGENFSTVPRPRSSNATLAAVAFSGHAMRDGLATAAVADVEARINMCQTRCCSAATVRRYIRDGELLPPTSVSKSCCGAE